MGSVRTIKESRVVILNGSIDDDTAEQVCVALLEFEAENPSSFITLMINSGGGSVTAGWQIIDTIRLIGNVETVCTGLCASMAALIVMSGQKGYRSALPHSRVMLHQPLGAAQLMTAADFEVTAKELARTKEELFTFIADCTGKSIKQISDDCDRDKWLTGAEAVEFGVVDRIVTADNR